MSNSLEILSLGQVGYQFKFKNCKWLIDPYLSNYVEEKYGKELARKVDVVLDPDDIFELDFVLITHDHEDHCDPVSLRSIATRNPSATVICPMQCNSIVSDPGFREILNPELYKSVNKNGIIITPVPVAHTEIELQDGNSRYLGYLMVINDFIIFHAGDTIPVKFKSSFPSKIDLGFLPINERNVFKERKGIVGNMTCREAIFWAEDLNMKRWIPTHWDMFEDNSVHKEELEVVAKNLSYSKFEWLDAGNRLLIDIY